MTNNKRIHKNNNPFASVCFQAPLVVSIRSLTSQTVSPSPCYRASPNVRAAAPNMRGSRLPIPYDSRFSRSKASQRKNSKNNINTENQPDSATTTSTSPSETSEQQQQSPASATESEPVVSSSVERKLNVKSNDDPLMVTDVSSEKTSNDAQQSSLNESTLNKTAPAIDTNTENEPVEMPSTASTSTSPLKQSEIGDDTDTKDPSVMKTSVVTVDKQSEKRDLNISSSSTGSNLDTVSNGSSTSTIDNVSKIDQLIPDTPQPSFDDGNINDDRNNNNNNNNGGGGGDNNEDDDDDDSERSELIRSLKLNEQEGKQASLLELRQLEAATRLPMLGWLASRWPALRERLGANPRLSLQMGVEICVGAGTKTLAEIQGRADRFWKEFDFVLSDLALEIVGDAILVWLLSPVVRASFSPIPRHFSQIGSFNASSRLAALFVKGFQFGCAGFLSSVIGHGLTRSLVQYRNNTRPSSNDEDDGVVLAPVLKTSLAWGSFLAISSNIRYQMVNGVEQRMLEPMFGQFLPALTAVTFALRLANCYVGSMMWLPWAKAWDLQ